MLNQTHAKPGTFDANEFVNTKTGRFQFPKYKHSKEYLIKIQDETDYREEIWNDLEPYEKREFTLKNFEECFYGPMLEVDDFETFFAKNGNPYLGPLAVLREDLDLVIELFEALNNNELCILDDESEKALTKGGFVFVRDVVSVEDRQKLLENFTVPALKSIAKTKGLKVGGKRAELLQRMMDSGHEFDLPRAYVAGPKFYEWIDTLAEGYIAEIRKNAKRFHPLYHEDIWLAADGYGIEFVEEKIACVQKSQYWISMMTT